MKKFRRRKIPSGSPKAVWASQMPTYQSATPRSRNSLRSGTSAIWIGTTMSATMIRKIVSRNGKRIHENA
jgi:hypothetical protein